MALPSVGFTPSIGDLENVALDSDSDFAVGPEWVHIPPVASEEEDCIMVHNYGPDGGGDGNPRCSAAHIVGSGVRTISLVAKSTLAGMRLGLRTEQPYEKTVATSANAVGACIGCASRVLFVAGCGFAIGVLSASSTRGRDTNTQS